MADHQELELPPEPTPRKDPNFGAIILAALILVGIVLYAFKAEDLMRQNALREAYTEGNQEEVLRLLTEMHEDAPDDPVPLSLRADILIRMGKPEAALDDHDAAVELAQDAFADKPEELARIYLGRAMTQLALRKTEAGIGDMETAIEKAPGILVAKNNLAWTLCTHPDTSVHDADRAITLATEVVTIQKRTHSGSLDTLAAAYARKGNFKKAIEVQQEAISVAIDPDEILVLDKHMDLFLDKKPVVEDPVDTYSLGTPPATQPDPQPEDLLSTDEA